MTLAIDTSALVKHFGDTPAVDGIDLEVDRGAVYGLLGPSGAGKTTTIRVLTTLLRPDGGSARVLGHDVAREHARMRERVCLTGQFASVNPVPHLANASRGRMHGDLELSDVVYVLVATTIITAVFAAIAMRMNHRER